ncbi:hypothetical protein BDR07DRAFT_1427995 [Suillus spraguei]|nr:hypothetical protein BDR07DRAFT_1427995 [Suillus spraguei]
MSVALFSGETKEKLNSQLLILKHGQKRVMVKRQRSYNHMLDSACKYFPSIPRDVVRLRTNQLDICDGFYADITAEIWDDVIDLLHVVEVTRGEEMTLPVSLPLDAHAIPSPDNQLAPRCIHKHHSSRNDDKVAIKVLFPSGEIQTARISRESRVDKLVTDASQILGYSTPVRAVQLKGGMGGVIMRENRSIGSYNVRNGDSINILQDPLSSPRGKKPVIYIYSPSDIDVSVKLSLIPEWTLSAIYPIVTTEDHGQRLEWNVRTHQDGSLTEHNSGLDVSYLFWEAETNLQVFPRSPASKPQPVDTFNPISSNLDDTDSIVIPVDKATAYLDESLKVLGLHTEARTSFISYWLPYILKYEYIALRFVPQSAYERAASLSIYPQPDIVTRIFMLFRGVSKEHLANWTNAQIQAEKMAGDVALFRVLEWGGMEIFI